MTHDRTALPPQSMDLSEEDLLSLTAELGTSTLRIILSTVMEAPAGYTGQEAGTGVSSPHSSDDEKSPFGSWHPSGLGWPGSNFGPGRYAVLRNFIQNNIGGIERLRRTATRCG